MGKGIAGGVLALAAVALAFLLVDLARGAEPDYADLVPAPDSIIVRTGDAPTFWLSTNRRAVDVRLGSIDLGIGEIALRNPATGDALPLGESLGCLDAIVSALDVAKITTTTATVTVTLDRNAGTPVRTYYRLYDTGTPGPVSHSDVSGATLDIPLIGLADGAAYRFVASADEHFTPAITRSITFTAGDADSGTSDRRAAEVPLLEGTGVKLLACNEHEDLAVTLHGADGAELNRYLVDVLPEATATPAPDQPPAFDPEYVARRVCVDDASGRGVYFDGNEQVGATVAAKGGDGTTTLNSTHGEYSLQSYGGTADYALFSVNGNGSITVSDLGADDDSGLDESRLYSFVIQAREDATGLTGQATVVVQVSKDESPGDNGRC